MSKPNRKPSESEEKKDNLGPSSADKVTSAKPNSRNGRKDERSRERAAGAKPNVPKAASESSYYATIANPQLEIDYASIAFNYRTGSRMRIDDDVANGPTISLYYGGESIPGVMAFEVAHCIGQALDENSAFNVCTRDHFQFIRSALSTYADYEWTDVAMYLEGMSDLRAFLSFMQRVYGSIMSYSESNAYIPVALFEAMHVNYQDISHHVADFRGYINTFANKLTSWFIPDTMPIYKRREWMYRDIYLDKALEKGQFYLFTPLFFRYFSPKTSTQGSELIPIFVSTRAASLTNADYPNPLTFADFCTLGDRLFTAFCGDQDNMQISSDMKRAYDGAMMPIYFIPEDYKAEIQADNAIVLSMIHNATVLPSIASWNGAYGTAGINAWDQFTVSQVQTGSTPYVFFDPAFRSAYPWGLKRILDFPVPINNPTLNTLALSFSEIPTYHVDPSDPTNYHWTIDTMGSDIICGSSVYKNAWSTGSSTPTLQRWDWDSIITTSLQAQTGASAVDAVTKFSNHPYLYRYAQVAVPTASQQYLGCIGDITYGTLIRADKLKGIHEQVLYAQYILPSKASYR